MSWLTEMGSGTRFLERLQTAADPADRWRVEHALAIARLFLAGGALVAVYIDPTQPTKYGQISDTLVWGFLVFAILAMVVLRVHRSASPKNTILFHILGMLWTIALSLVTFGPGSAALLFFVFGIVAAATRWNMRYTVYTSFLFGAVLVGEAVLFSTPVVRDAIGVEVDFDRLIMRGVGLVIAGVFIGYLGQADKQRSAELTAITALGSRLQVDKGVRGALLTISKLLGGWLNTPHTICILRDVQTGAVSGIELGNEERELSAMEAARAWIETEAQTVRLRRRGKRWIEEPVVAGGALIGAGVPAPQFDPHKRVFVTTFGVPGQWTAQMSLWDSPFESEAPVLFLSRATRQLPHLVQNAFLTDKMKDDAIVAERGRIARELHDGAVQSLVGIGIQLDAMRHTVELPPPAVDTLDRLKNLLREEIAALRDLMNNLRSVTVTGDDLVHQLSALTQRVRMQGDCTIKFVSSESVVDLPAPTCRELFRIVQEALVNIRKHSGARNVMVRLDRDPDRDRDRDMWRLTVDDDGHGFDFAGVYTLEELDRTRRGPIVIKERVRAINGALTITSKHGSGSRLEVVVAG